MKKRLLTLALGATLLAGGAAAVTLAIGSSFASAPTGAPVAFTPLTLPAVVQPLHERTVWAPLTSELLNGEAVITNHRQMEDVYRRLFNQQWNRSLVDFNQNYVVLMGGGQMTTSSFAISSVEEVDADWNNFFFGTEMNRFMAVTATTTHPGVAPPVPPPATWRVSAVVIQRTYFDDVVFHRTVIALP